MEYLIKRLSIITFSLFILACGGANEKASTDSNINPTKLDGISLSDSIPQIEDEVQEEVQAVPLDTSFFDFAFIADNKYIILPLVPDTSWGIGKPSVEAARAGVYYVIKDLEMDSLPLAYAGLIGNQFNICGTNQVYNAKIKSIKILAEFIPHFGRVQAWDGFYEEISMTEEEKANDIWNSAEHFLVAEFEIENRDDDDDDELFYATPADKLMPKPYSILSDSVENAVLANRVGDVCSNTADYKEVQKAYEETAKRGDDMWWKDEYCRGSFSYFEVGQEVGFAAVNNVAGNGCGDPFYAEMFSIWKLNKQAKPVLLFMGNDYYQTVFANDIDGDDYPEFLLTDWYGKTTLLKKVGEDWLNVYQWSIPYQDCPC
ncbi:MAG: hypothetical protein HRT71_09510 [Flavobacteriales bacterium]|nr:hypothetical protein [Flavobacteriales bacterium]